MSDVDDTTSGSEDEGTGPRVSTGPANPAESEPDAALSSEQDPHEQAGGAQAGG